ncbi:MAG: ribosome biogenesis GTP-binding protein YihA/YsxC [Betaproteobacteria bacterium]
MKKRRIVAESPGAAHPNPPPDAAKVRRPLLGAEFMIAAAVPAQWPPAGPAEIAFAGRSNSGKSSAINVLARRTRLAFASRTPGRTQQIVFFALADGARAADLPGYGYAAVSRDIKREWQRSLWDYVTTRSTLVGLVLVADSRHGLKPLDLALLDGFVPSGRPVMILATKSDKLNIAQRRDAAAAIRAAVDARYAGAGAGAVEVILFSATTHVGLEAADALLDAWLPRPEPPGATLR